VQVRHEALTGIMERLESELAACQRSIDATSDKATHLGEAFAKLEKAQAAMDEKLARCATAKKAVEGEIEATDKAFMRAGKQNAEVEEKLGAVLGEHVTVEKGAGGAAKQIQQIRRTVRGWPAVV
jgi:septal ring factor EnvC (AmiA/AmiB activator)